MRMYRRYIPSLIPSNELDPDNIYKGFEICIEEFKDNYKSYRKPWRTLIRVTDVDDTGTFFYVVVPGWDSKEKIRLPFTILEKGVHHRIEPDYRFHAYVNKGSENQDDLYFTDFEFD